jgi:transcriptional regulator with XRE-family HTH domain
MTMLNEQTNPYEFSLGDRMKKSLRVAGLSRDEMAQYLDVDPGTVSTWMNDRIRPSKQTLRLWTMKTGAPWVWLITGEYTPRDLNPEPTVFRKIRNLHWQPANYIGLEQTEAA